MEYFITGVVILMIVVLIGLVGIGMKNAATWMDDSWRWGGKDV